MDHSKQNLQIVVHSTGFAGNLDLCKQESDQFPGKCSCPKEQEYLQEGNQKQLTPNRENWTNMKSTSILRLHSQTTNAESTTSHNGKHVHIELVTLFIRSDLMLIKKQSNDNME